MRTQIFLANALFSTLAGTALLAPTARAQSTITPNPTCDMIMGFQVETLYVNGVAQPAQDNGMGDASDLEIDLGPASEFYDAAPGSSFTLPALTEADLAAIYGSGWNDRTDLFWGIIGTTGNLQASGTWSNGGTIFTPDGYAPKYTIWATRAETTPGTQSIPWTNSTTYALSGPISHIEALDTNGAPLISATSTANSPDAAVIGTSVAGSWTLEDDYGSSSGLSFNYFSGTIDNIADTAGGAAVSDLYQVESTNSGNAQLLGDFSLNDNGVLTYTAAVPEPSSVALIGLATFAFALLLHRKPRAANRPDAE